MMKMNSVTMMIVFCLSGSLLLAPSCDAVVYKICNMMDFFEVYFAICPISFPNESVAPVERPSNSGQATTTGSQ